MKKLVFALFAMTLTFTSFAQLSVGVRGGVNFATQSISGDDASSLSLDGITGLFIAIPVEIGITENFSVQPELTYLQKGSSFSFDILGFNTESSTTLNYFELPVLAKYKFVKTDDLGVYAAAGPTFGYALGGESKVSIQGVEETTDFDFDAEENEDFNRFDLGLSLGAGVEYKAGPGSIVLDLRYVLGLSNLNGGENDGVTTKNNGFAASIGYMLTLGNN
ncbi:MAG: porin family protein [Saprospiraceae bacterium]